MGLVSGNVSSMSNFPPSLSYTEFTLSDSRYPPSKLARSAQPNTSTSAFQQQLTNSNHEWSSNAVQMLNNEASTRKDPIRVLQSPRPLPRQSPQTSQSSPPQEQGANAIKPLVPSNREARQSQDATTSPQGQQPGTTRSPPVLPSGRDYTTPRQQSANLANYYPTANGYPSHQIPSTSTYNPSQIPIPVSPKPRAYAQQPTYITPGANSPIPVYMKYQVPKEEVCVECAMRDQDMADVDVVGPGVWDRESDVLYADLLQREEEARLTDTPLPEDPHRPNATGDMLTETNLKFHLSMIPREPASRHKNLETYVKAQRLLLEAETLAHARAMQESMQLESKMRDTYSQLRRSVYEVGSLGNSLGNASSGRFRTPRSTSMPSGSPGFTLQGHSRAITLLENGLIMEHVDVKKEEKEDRERRRKEAKRERSRARELSRSSGADMNSIYYSSLNVVHSTDSGITLGLKPDPRYSQSSLRPGSILSTSGDPSVLAKAQSTASFSDIHSITSASSPNRQTRFFGLKNLSAGWRSRDSIAASGVSGSMMDMHVALHQEQNQNFGYPQPYPSIDLGNNASMLRMEESLSQTEEKLINMDGSISSGTRLKKKTGLAKIWGMVTGSSRAEPRQRNEMQALAVKSEDDFPLTPPPPLSYLVDREHGMTSRRHLSSPSLPSTVAAYPSTSPQNASPPTEPSSPLPSPTLSRVDALESRLGAIYDPDPELQIINESSKSRTMPNIAFAPSSDSLPTMVGFREKSLPPLPAESSVKFPSDGRPQTMFALDRHGDDLAPPHAPFRSGPRRQSFGGLESRPYVQSATFNGLSGPEVGIYDEFGTSRLSLGWWDDSQSPGAPRAATKGRSRFLSSLFGKKDKGDGTGSVGHASTLYSMRSSEHEARGFGATGPRMSVSIQRVQQLVDQDPDFVAYRYPSNDRPLDLFR